MKIDNRAQGRRVSEWIEVTRRGLSILQASGYTVTIFSKANPKRNESQRRVEGSEWCFMLLNDVLFCNCGCWGFCETDPKVAEPPQRSWASGWPGNWYSGLPAWMWADVGFSRDGYSKEKGPSDMRWYAQQWRGWVLQSWGMGFNLISIMCQAGTLEESRILSESVHSSVEWVLLYFLGGNNNTSFMWRWKCSNAVMLSTMAGTKKWSIELSFFVLFCFVLFCFTLNWCCYEYHSQKNFSKTPLRTFTFTSESL